LSGFEIGSSGISLNTLLMETSASTAGMTTGIAFANNFKDQLVDIVPESEGLTAFFEGLGTPSGNGFKTKFQSVINTVSANNTTIKSNFETLGTNSGNGFKTKLLAVINNISVLNTTIKTYFENLGRPSGTAFTTKFLEVLNVITVANTTIRDYFSGLGTSSGNAFRSSFLSVINSIKPTITVRVTYVETNRKPFNIGGEVVNKTVYMNDGGRVGYNSGGKVNYANNGMYSSMMGTVPGFGNYDNVPALLTPGEFVIRREAVEKYGKNFFAALNSTIYNKKPDFSMPSFSSSYGMSEATVGNVSAGGSSSVYNNSYQINVNVASESNPDEIAKTVMAQIKRVESRKIRGNRI
jgi:hypothetical protein